MTPREFFPKMPDEVYDMWLAPIIAEYGWPFKGVGDSLENTKWKYVLGDIDLGVWFRLEWVLKDFQISTIPLSQGSRMSISGLIHRCVEGRDTFFAGVVGSEERFRACVDFIIANGKIPKTIVGLMRSGQFEILDGNHRIAALLSISPTRDFTFQAWMPQNPKQIMPSKTLGKEKLSP